MCGGSEGRAGSGKRNHPDTRGLVASLTAP